MIGAAGDIGRRVVRSLIMLGVPTADLLVAGRRPEVLPEVLGSASSTGRRVDVNDPRGLTAFAGDVDLVIDATGPSHERALTTARLVGRAGAHLVSVGGPADARTVSSLEPPGDRRVLMYAGALPGVSGIVARAALLDDPGTATLEVCAGGRGAFTLAGAEDYLAGLDHGDVRPLAGWRSGRPLLGGVERREAVTLPEFPETVTLFPFLDAEGEQIAQGHGLREATWYSAMVGDEMTHLLRLVAGLGVAAGAVRLRDATTAMAAGRRPYVVIRARTRSRQLVLRSPGEAALAGVMAAAAAVEVLAGAVAPGASAASQALDPTRVLELLTCPGSQTTVLRSVLPPPETLTELGVRWTETEMEEGEL
ncbi:saccharopine dehydrogenase NADP-binding domain-containing protein [Arsenicicoccus dermatophilus]|uniref:saccharopine dehydrogenase NADP-binding domain-containing protein n=1 Tax=Arsenicicoccus dermatophilus TaxID=1076331 RepID=UPI001F4CAA92|nr:saccharopine dehydrogenase NADP-binding domain-containing protein [Arsenicicoccus dermatophilus]